jgi:hypothetical protein
VREWKASGELPQRVVVRSSKYLNNRMEQDHRRVKQRLRAMVGLKNSKTAAVGISGIELAEKIQKGQFQIGQLGGTRAVCRRSGRLPWLHNRRSHPIDGVNPIKYIPSLNLHRSPFEDPPSQPGLRKLLKT